MAKKRTIYRDSKGRFISKAAYEAQHKPKRTYARDEKGRFIKKSKADQKSAKKQPSAQYSDLRKEYKKLAKKADRRLRQLEKISNTKHFEVATKWAYRRAMRDLQKVFGEGSNRFDRSIATGTGSIARLKSAITSVERFLASESSKKTGIINIYKKRAESINKEYAKYGIEFTWQELAEYFGSAMQDKMEEKFSSGTALRKIGEQLKNKDKIIEELQTQKNNYQYAPTDKEVMEKITENLAARGLKKEDLK